MSQTSCNSYLRETVKYRQESVAPLTISQFYLATPQEQIIGCQTNIMYQLSFETMWQKWNNYSLHKQEVLLPEMFSQTICLIPQTVPQLLWSHHTEMQSDKFRWYFLCSQIMDKPIKIPTSTTSDFKFAIPSHPEHKTP